MKRSDMVNQIVSVLESLGLSWTVYGVEHSPDEDAANAILNMIETHMEPKQYINPKAHEDDIIDPSGEFWSHLRHIDKYPDHHYTHKNKKPYEFYLNGWEEENEEK